MIAPMPALPRRAGRQRHATRLQQIHRHNRIRHGRSDGQQAMIAQDQRALVAQVSRQPRLLVGVQRDTFAVVAGQAVQHQFDALHQAFAADRSDRLKAGSGLCQDPPELVSHDAGVVDCVLGSRKPLPAVWAQRDGRWQRRSATPRRPWPGRRVELSARAAAGRRSGRRRRRQPRAALPRAWPGCW